MEEEVKRRVARTREGDKGKRAWLKAWWSGGGRDLVVGVTALTACIGVFVLAVLIYRAAEQRADDQRIVRVLAQQQALLAKDAAKAARASCLRSMTIGPSIADYYARDPHFPDALLEQYKATIPKSCPKAP